MTEREALGKAILLLAEEYLRIEKGFDIPDIIATLKRLHDDLPEPPFVPTEPGWYWARFDGEIQPLRVYAGVGGTLYFKSVTRPKAQMLIADGWNCGWLGPAEPYREDK